MATPTRTSLKNSTLDKFLSRRQVSKSSTSSSESGEDAKPPIQKVPSIKTDEVKREVSDSDGSSSDAPSLPCVQTQNEMAEKEKTGQTSSSEGSQASSESEDSKPAQTSNVDETVKKSPVKSLPTPVQEPSKTHDVSDSSDEDDPVVTQNTTGPNLLDTSEINNCTEIKISDIKSDSFALEDLTEDDEVFLLQCPISVNINALKGQKIQLPGLSDFVIDPKKEIRFECIAQREDSNRNLSIILPSRKNKGFKLCILPLAGSATLCKKVEVSPVQPPNILEKTKVPFPDFLINKNPTLRQLLSNAERSIMSKNSSIGKAEASSDKDKTSSCHSVECTPEESPKKKRKKKKDNKHTEESSEKLNGPNIVKEEQPLIPVVKKEISEIENVLEPTQPEEHTVKKKHHKKKHKEHSESVAEKSVSKSQIKSESLDENEQALAVHITETSQEDKANKKKHKKKQKHDPDSSAGNEIILSNVKTESDGLKETLEMSMDVDQPPEIQISANHGEPAKKKHKKKRKEHSDSTAGNEIMFSHIKTESTTLNETSMEVDQPPEIQVPANHEENHKKKHKKKKKEHSDTTEEITSLSLKREKILANEAQETTVGETTAEVYGTPINSESSIKKKHKKKDKELPGGHESFSASFADSRLLELSIMNKVSSTPNSCFTNAIKSEHGEKSLQDEETLPADPVNETVIKKKKRRKDNGTIEDPEATQPKELTTVPSSPEPKKKKKKKKDKHKDAEEGLTELINEAVVENFHLKKRKRSEDTFAEETIPKKKKKKHSHVDPEMMIATELDNLVSEVVSLTSKKKKKKKNKDANDNCDNE